MNDDRQAPIGYMSNITLNPSRMAKIEMEFSDSQCARPRQDTIARVRVASLTLLLAVFLASAALVAPGCGSDNSATTNGQTRTSRPARRAHRRPSGVGVGATQRVHTGAETRSVRVFKVFNPLRDSGATLPPGQRAVGVLVSILNHGPAVYDSSSTTDISLASSSGPGTVVFASHGVCQTPLRNFDNEISAGEQRSGCVAFAVANGAKVTAVRFSPHGRAADRVSWRVG